MSLLSLFFTSSAPAGPVLLRVLPRKNGLRRRKAGGKKAANAEAEGVGSQGGKGKKPQHYLCGKKCNQPQKGGQGNTRIRPGFCPTAPLLGGRVWRKGGR
ncbi:hypothetical protein CRENBAI_010625, partial [Crenichthys baileyi]